MSKFFTKKSSHFNATNDFDSFENSAFQRFVSKFLAGFSSFKGGAESKNFKGLFGFTEFNKLLLAVSRFFRLTTFAGFARAFIAVAILGILVMHFAFPFFGRGGFAPPM